MPALLQLVGTQPARRGKGSALGTDLLGGGLGCLSQPIVSHTSLSTLLGGWSSALSPKSHRLDIRRVRKNGTKRTVKEFCFSDKGKESNPSSPLGKATIAGSHAFYLFILTFAAIYQLQEAGPGLSWLSSLHPPSVHTAETPFHHPAHPSPTVGTGRGRRGPRCQEHAADGKAGTTDSQGLPL